MGDLLGSPRVAPPPFFLTDNASFSLDCPTIGFPIVIKRLFKDIYSKFLRSTLSWWTGGHVLLRPVGGQDASILLGIFQSSRSIF